MYNTNHTQYENKLKLFGKYLQIRLKQILKCKYDNLYNLIIIIVKTSIAICTHHLFSNQCVKITSCLLAYFVYSLFEPWARYLSFFGLVELIQKRLFRQLIYEEVFTNLRVSSLAAVSTQASVILL